MKKIGIDKMQVLETYMLNKVIDVCEENEIPYFLYVGSALAAVRHGGPIPWDTDVDIAIPYPYTVKFVESCNKSEEFSKDLYVWSYICNKKCTRLQTRVCFKGLQPHPIHVDVFPLIGFPDDKEEQIKTLQELKHIYNLFHLKQRRAVYHKNLIKQVVLRIKRYINSFSVHLSAESIYREFDAICTKYNYYESGFVGKTNNSYGLSEILNRDILGDGIESCYCKRKVIIPYNYDLYLRQIFGNYMEYPDKEYIDEKMNTTMWVSSKVYKKIISLKKDIM
jgi:lipopolysaccharide cholinephosphotransferase